jgi:bifunctional non-homologous end joining protein LigD
LKARQRDDVALSKPKEKNRKQPFVTPDRLKKAAALQWRAPQLALLSERPPTDPRFVHELKFDGYRIQGIVKKGQASLWTRRGLDWTEKFPRIAHDLEALDIDGLHVDGEIVVEDQNGIADFTALQMAIKSANQSHLVFYIFDLFAVTGKDVTGLPLHERKQILEDLLKARNHSPDIRYSLHFETSGDEMLKHVCRAGAEGIVSKRKDKKVSEGRNGDWLKSKCVNRQEFVVVGFTPSTTNSKSIGSLILGLYEGDTLIHVGRVGTGFSQNLAQDLYKDLNALRIAQPPFAERLSRDATRRVTWVKPDMVAEIGFRGWTGGGILRQAAFKGIRDDKDPHEVKRESAAGTPIVSSNCKTRHLTHPDRLLWQDAGITKEGLADYYEQIWPWIKPHIINRPLALVRCPIGAGQSCFFQKHEWKGMSSDLLRIRSPRDSKPLVAINSLDGLISLVQASVLEIHPWGASIDQIDHPDRIIFDLDPGEDVTWPALVQAAEEVRARLLPMKLESFVKTTGGKGLHVVLPIAPNLSWDEVKNFAYALANAMAKDSPQRYTAIMAKRERGGRIFIDYLRNTRGATAVAAYSTRAGKEAGVSTPVDWTELKSLISAAQFTLLNLETRLSHLKGDPWEGINSLRQKLPARLNFT